ncbi:MAG TPA: bifunctional DNA primase/polymerase [Anaerolineae bacterium]|nr:bifunctional DNA primase/polymerase [Anaerolineae bacterium]
MNLLESAQCWLSRGIVPLPCWPGTKAAAEPWKRWQQELPPVDLVRHWFAKPRNLALICGGLPRLVVLDFDDSSAYAQWCVEHSDAVPTYTVLTPRPGIHVYLYTCDTAPSFDFDGGETRGQGRYVLSPPSTHPSGKPYTVLIDAPIRHVALRDVMPQQKIPGRPTSLSDGGVSSVGLPGILEVGAGGQPGVVARIKAGLSILDVARAAGVELRSSDHGAGRWYAGLCPFHDDRHPSLWVDTARQRWGCHKPTCKARHSGDTLDLYSMVNGIGLRDAIHALAEVLPLDADADVSDVVRQIGESMPEPDYSPPDGELPCWMHGPAHWWKRPDGSPVCGVCHPDPARGVMEQVNGV